MSLNSRATEARQAVRAGLVVEEGKAWRTPSKSRRGSWHDVYLRWWDGKLRATCAEVNPLGQCDCAGNANGHICWHVLAAVVARSKKAGKSVAFCENLDKAERLSRTGGEIRRLYSGQGKGACFIVVK